MLWRKTISEDLAESTVNLRVHDWATLFEYNDSALGLKMCIQVSMARSKSGPTHAVDRVVLAVILLFPEIRRWNSKNL